MSQIKYIPNIETANTYTDLEPMAAAVKKGHASFVETFLIHNGVHA